MPESQRKLTGNEFKQALREAKQAYTAPAYPGKLIDDLGLDKPSLYERLTRWRWPAAVAAMLALAAGVWWAVDRSIGKNEPTRTASVVETPVPEDGITPPVDTAPAVAETDPAPTVPSAERIEAITLLARAALGELLVGRRLPPMPSALSFPTRALTAAMPAMPRLTMPSPGGLPRPDPSLFSPPPSS